MTPAQEYVVDAAFDLTESYFSGYHASSAADVAELQLSFATSLAAYTVRTVQLTDVTTGGASVVDWRVVATLPSDRASGFASDIVQQPAVMNLLNTNARAMGSSHANSMFQLVSTVTLSSPYVGTVV